MYTHITCLFIAYTYIHAYSPYSSNCGLSVAPSNGLLVASSGGAHTMVDCSTLSDAYDADLDAARLSLSHDHVFTKPRLQTPGFWYLRILP